MNKLISIVLPTFNGEKYIRESIESVLNQSYKNWELIIVNDCSTDNTGKIIEEYVKLDSRIKLITNSQNEKLPKSLNIGFENANGEYYTWTSDDNIYKQNALEYMVNFLEKHKDIDLISCNFDFINENKIFKSEFNENIKDRCALQLALQCNIGACFLYTKNIAQKVGKYDENMFCAEDYDYWCRLALKGNIFYCNENLYQYRFQNNSLTSTKQNTIKEKTELVQKKYSKKIINKYKSKCYSFYLKNIIGRNIKNFIYSKQKSEHKKKYKIFGIKITIKNTKYSDKFEIYNDNTFFNFKIRPNSVLIVEPNNYHAEILPGFVKYFQDLGYKTDIFLRHENFLDSPFLDTSKINIFRGSAKHIKKMLKNENIKNYEFIFFSSSAYWEQDINHSSYLKYLGFTPKCRNGLFLVEHNIIPYLKQYREEKYLKEEKLFTLSGFQQTPMLNPHYFGNVKITEKSDDKTRFIVVGGINKNCKNHKLLLDSIPQLITKNKNFEITIVGSGDELEIPKELKNHIIKKGRLSYKEMYSEMEKADFFLPLLDPDNTEHKRYLESTTSGSRQLIMGFLKPCIINKNFAQAYNFTDENSIIYDKNQLALAMEKAMNLDQEKYKKLQESLDNLSKSVYEKSLKNLEFAIDKNRGKYDRAHM